MKLPIYTAAVGGVVSLLVVGGVFAIRPRKAVSPAALPTPHPALSEYQQKRYNQALFNATEANNFTKVQWCVRAGADVNSLWDDVYHLDNLQYPLSNAAFNQNLEMCRFLVKNGADPDGRNLRYSPLYHAVEQSDLKAAQILLEVGANPAAAGDPDIAEATISPLDLAAQRGNTAFLKLMLAHMPSLSSVEKQEYFQEANNALLNQAISSSTLSRIQQLVAKGAEFDFEDGTPLLNAASHRSVPVVKFLLEHGVDANTQAEDKQIALMEAVAQGSVQVLNILLEHQAKVDQQDERGRTALMYSGLTDMHYERLMPPSLDYVTAEIQQQRKRRLTGETTRILVEHGAKVNMQDKSGMTALMYAVQGNGEATEVLLAHRAQVNLRDKGARMALHYAAEARDFRSLRALLRYGAEVNIRDVGGVTPLMLATLMPEAPTAKKLALRLKCIKILRQYGANPNLKDREGHTAKYYSELVDGYDITAS